MSFKHQSPLCRLPVVTHPKNAGIIEILLLLFLPGLWLMVVVVIHRLVSN